MLSLCFPCLQTSTKHSGCRSFVLFLRTRKTYIIILAQAHETRSVISLSLSLSLLPYIRKSQSAPHNLPCSLSFSLICRLGAQFTYTFMIHPFVLLLQLAETLPLWRMPGPRTLSARFVACCSHVQNTRQWRSVAQDTHNRLSTTLEGHVHVHEDVGINARDAARQDQAQLRGLGQDDAGQDLGQGVLVVRMDEVPKGGADNRLGVHVQDALDGLVGVEDAALTAESVIMMSGPSSMMDRYTRMCFTYSDTLSRSCFWRWRDRWLQTHAHAPCADPPFPAP